MATQWFAQINGIEEGPFAPAELVASARQGRIKPDTPVRNGEAGKWVKAGQVKGLFEAAKSGAAISAKKAASTVPPAAPPCSVSQGQQKALPQQKPIVLYLLLVSSLAVNLLLGVCLLFLDRQPARPTPQTDTPLVAAIPAAPERQPEIPPKHAETPAGTPDPQSPEQVVYAYLTAKTWPERLALVLEPDRVRPLMAQYYGQTNIENNTLSKARVLPVGEKVVPIGDRLDIIVDITEAMPDSRTGKWLYVLQRLESGYKIDWEASVARQTEIETEAEKQGLALGAPVLHFEPLRLFDQLDHAVLEFRVTNQSMRTLSYWRADIEVYGADGKPLGSEFINETNHPAKEAVTKKFSFDRTLVEPIRSWRLRLSDVAIDLNGSRMDLMKFFTAVQSDSIKDGRPVLRTALSGHWQRPGHADMHISSLGAIASDTLYSFHLIEIDFQRPAVKIRVRTDRTDQIEFDCTLSSNADQLLIGATAIQADGEWTTLSKETLEEMQTSLTLGEWNRVEQSTGPTSLAQRNKLAKALVQATKTNDAENQWDSATYVQLICDNAAGFVTAENANPVDLAHATHRDQLALWQTALNVAKRFDAAMRLLPTNISLHKTTAEQIRDFKKHSAKLIQSSSPEDAAELRDKLKELENLVKSYATSIKMWKEGFIGYSESDSSDALAILEKYKVPKKAIEGSEVQWIKASEALAILVEAAQGTESK